MDDAEMSLVSAIEDLPFHYSGPVNRSSLGHYLKRNANRPVGGLRLEKAPCSERNAWRVVKAKGYLRISKAAGVPIALIGIDARSKEVVLHEEIWKYTGANNDEDNTAIKNFVDANFFGINQTKQ